MNEKILTKQQILSQFTRDKTNWFHLKENYYSEEFLLALEDFDIQTQTANTSSCVDCSNKKKCACYQRKRECQIGCECKCMIKKCKNNHFSTSELNDFGENAKFFEIIKATKDNNWKCQAKQHIPEGSLIMEYRGCFHTYEEYNDSLDLYNLLLPHICVFTYKKTPKYGYRIHIDGEENNIQYCIIDARLFGNNARFMRYSCISNTRIKKRLINGNFVIGIYAHKNIGIREEITIPWPKFMPGQTNLDYRRMNCCIETCVCNLSNCGVPKSVEYQDHFTPTFNQFSINENLYQIILNVNQKFYQSLIEMPEEYLRLTSRNIPNDQYNYNQNVDHYNNNNNDDYYYKRNDHYGNDNFDLRNNNNNFTPRNTSQPSRNYNQRNNNNNNNTANYNNNQSRYGRGNYNNSDNNNYRNNYQQNSRQNRNDDRFEFDYSPRDFSSQYDHNRNVITNNNNNNNNNNNRGRNFRDNNRERPQNNYRENRNYRDNRRDYNNNNYINNDQQGSIRPSLPPLPNNNNINNNNININSMVNPLQTIQVKNELTSEQKKAIDDYREKINYFEKLSREVVIIKCNSIDDLYLTSHSPKPEAVEFDLLLLELTDSEFSDAVKYWSSLIILSISTPPPLVSDRGLISLTSLTNLQSLEIRNCDNITNRCVTRLKNLTSLVRLGLSGCKSVLTKDLLSLTQLRSLTSLDLSSIPSVNTKFIELLEDSFPILFELKLSDCDSLNEHSLSFIFRLTMLTKLELSGCFNIQDNPNVIFRNRLANAKMETLNIRNTKLAETIARLTIFSSLYSLNISTTNVIDNQLAPLSTISSLRELDISSCRKLTEYCMLPFSRLLYLNATQTKISSEGVEHLKLFPQARILIDDY